MAEAPKPSSSVKLVLLGEAAVGKVRGELHCLYKKTTNHIYIQSSLVLRFVNNDFQENKEPTIGGKSRSTMPAPKKTSTTNIAYPCSCFPHAKM